MTTQMTYASDRPTHYKHSGKFSPLGVVLGLVVGSAVGVAAAFVYAYGTIYIPIVYVAVLLTAALGGVAGYVTGAMLKTGKVRSVPVALLVTLIVTAVTYSAAWVFWLNAHITRHNAAAPAAKQVELSMMDLVTHPANTMKIISGINKTGTWGMKKAKDAVKGGMLSVVWTIEAGVILVVALMVAKSRITALPFCENCNRWGVKKDLVNTAPAADDKAFRALMEARDFPAISAVGPVQDPHNFYHFWLEGCPDCDTTQTLSAEHTQITVNHKNQTSASKTSIVKRLWLAPEELVAVATEAAMVQTAAAAPPPAAEPSAPPAPNEPATQTPPPPPPPTA